ncbi:hypothetical protein KJ673_02485 [Patescibacteria group bacterium]|nr:hypothetical protein [Patescibacteria group bacterium]MBU4452967.1 hypothetical protein [Patescibacteria group bacterium]MCG2687688.1 hypothetical protein [Candidatus Parcubacteria bacterium]
MYPNTFILIECIDPRLSHDESRRSTQSAIRAKLGEDAISMHHYRVPGPSPLLAGTRDIIPDDRTGSSRVNLVDELIWNIHEIEEAGGRVDVIVVCGHDQGCAAESGADLKDPDVLFEHLDSATLFLNDGIVKNQMRIRRDTGIYIRQQPVVLGLIQHLSGTTPDSVVISAEFLNQT